MLSPPMLRVSHPPVWSGHCLPAPAGKIMRILDRGTSSIQDVMTVLLFNVLPQLADVLAACVYMALKLQLWTAIIVGMTGERQHHAVQSR